jgi:hypothetical protein
MRLRHWNDARAYVRAMARNPGPQEVDTAGQRLALLVTDLGGQDAARIIRAATTAATTPRNNGLARRRPGETRSRYEWSRKGIGGAGDPARFRLLLG